MGSPAAPHSLLSPRSLRSLGLPASFVQGKPLHYVVRATDKAEQSHINLLRPHSLVLRAAVRLRLSVGLRPTGSNALAFRAVSSRASLP